jgi:iron complex transport system substrate-binding protein
VRFRPLFRLVSLVVLALLLSPQQIGPTGATAVATPAVDSCSASATPEPSLTPAFPLVITDDADRQVTIKRMPERIISLAPSNTEMLFALGLAGRVVGVDSFSNYPPEATQKPQVGDYINPDLEAIVAAEPDLILATAAHMATVVPDLDLLGLPAVVIEPANLDEVFAGLALLGQVTGATSSAQRLSCDLQARVETVTAAIAGAPPTRVFFELGPDLFTAGPGSFIDDILVRAGGENVAAGAAEMWPQLSAEAVVSADPEVILLADQEAGVTAESVSARPGWQAISAVQDGRIVAIDADLVARPGPRVVDGLEAVAAALHPDRVPIPIPEPGS